MTTPEQLIAMPHFTKGEKRKFKAIVEKEKRGDELNKREAGFKDYLAEQIANLDN